MKNQFSLHHSLFSLLSHGTPERHQYLVRAVKWSCGDTHKLGHPRLHQLLAQTLWKGERRVDVEQTSLQNTCIILTTNHRIFTSQNESAVVMFHPQRRTMAPPATTTCGQRTAEGVRTCWWSCTCWEATPRKLTSSSPKLSSSEYTLGGDPWLCLVYTSDKGEGLHRLT